MFCTLQNKAITRIYSSGVGDNTVRPQGLKSEEPRWDGFLGPPHQLEVWGSAVSSHSEVQVKALAEIDIHCPVQ